MTQKVLKVGNSFAVTLPKEFVDAKKLIPGQIVYVESDPEIDLVQIRTTPIDTSLTPEFKEWLDDVSRTYKDTIQDLAKR